MTPLEMIEEWRKGCPCGSRPEECLACTRALIDRLELSLRTSSFTTGADGAIAERVWVDGVEFYKSPSE